MDPDDTSFLHLYLMGDAALNRRNCADVEDNVGTPRAQRIALGDTLLRIGLAHCTGTASTVWQIGRSAAGGPMIRQTPGAQWQLHLSLSHSGDYLAAGICSAAPLGIDIECNRKRRFTEIAQHLDWPAVIGHPPDSLEADGFYHLWTLWEAAIKSCSSETDANAESVFKLLVPELTVGIPDTRPTQDWLAGSWQCPGRFWLSVIARDPHISGIRIFVVNGLESLKQTPQISEIAVDDGFLKPEIFRRQHSKII